MHIFKWSAAFTSRRLHAACLAVVVSATVAALTATSVAVASTACGQRFYNPKSGGYAIILANVRATGVSCAKAARIAGAHMAQERKPSGWRCSTAENGGRTICRKGAARVAFTFDGTAG